MPQENQKPKGESWEDSFQRVGADHMIPDETNTDEEVGTEDEVRRAAADARKSKEENK